MRVLIANAHRNLVGGAEKYLHALIPALIERDYTVGLLHEFPAAGDHETIDAGVRGLPVWCVSDMGREAVLRAVVNWAPDIVYCHGLEDDTIEDSFLELYPTVLFAHNYYGACGTGRKCHLFPEARPCTRSFGWMCLAMHYPRRCGGLNPLTALRSFRRQARVNARLSGYRSILVASAHMRREYLRQGVPSDRLHLVPLPVTETERYADPPAQKAPQGRILFIGRLTDLKGGPYLVAAIPKAAQALGRPLTLTVAGDGPERRPLQELAEKLRVTAEFTGWIDTPTKLNLLAETDLLAVPSVWPEPFGLVGIEAGCHGAPAVGYDVGGISDWLIPGESGELAAGNPPTVEGLSSAIVRALADPNHYARLCRGAWEIAGRFNMKRHMETLNSILAAAVSVERAYASPAASHPY